MSLTGNQSVESLDYVDFGYVNCASMKLEQIYLMNDTTVDTNWVINYVKFILKKNIKQELLQLKKKKIWIYVMIVLFLILMYLMELSMGLLKFCFIYL